MAVHRPAHRPGADRRPPALGGAGMWWFVLRHGGPAAVNLDQAAAGVSIGATPTTDPSGTWTVDPTITKAGGTGTFAGFRVDERLVGIGAATAVGDRHGGGGRQPVDRSPGHRRLTRITTDDARRDNAVQGALGTSRYPRATFVLSQPGPRQWRYTHPEQPTRGVPVTCRGARRGT